MIGELGRLEAPSDESFRENEIVAGRDRQEGSASARRKNARAFAIAELLSRLSRVLQSTGYAEDLNPAQWDALRFFAEGLAEPTASAFARYQGIQRASANETVRTLARRGLVERDANPHNARKQDILLSAEARDLLTRDPLRDIAQKISELDEGEVNSLAEALSLLYRLLVRPSAREQSRRPPTNAVIRR